MHMTTRRRAEVQNMIGYFPNNMIGYFPNLVALRLECDLGTSFRNCFAEVRNCVMGAQQHCEIPYGTLAEQLVAGGGGAPPIQVTLTESNDYVGGEIKFAGLKLGRDCMAGCRGSCGEFR